jgi:hypothetical protein
VGKIFEPALRIDATQRAVGRLLADLTPADAELLIEYRTHTEHGGLISVRIANVVVEARGALASRVSAMLDPLAMKHEIVWG